MREIDVEDDKNGGGGGGGGGGVLDGDKFPGRLATPPPFVAGGQNNMRPYSHSELGFGAWAKCSRRDAGACIGLDFGGTLSKIVFFEPKEIPEYCENLAKFLLSSKTYGESGVRDEHLSFYSEKMGGRIHFINFETSHTSGAISLLQKFGGSQLNLRKIHSTGGGAFKYSQLIKEKLGIRLIKKDELETVVRGIVFTLLEHPESECYTLEPIIDHNEEPTVKRHHGVSHVDALSYEMQKVPIPMPVARDSFFPLLVVNIGSGVSVINVTGPTTFKRVSGTAIGGATYYGLCKLLCRCQSFDQAMDLAELGDSRDVNLTVQDIYGGSYEQAGLSGEITASFFGKAAAAPGNVRTTRSRKRPYVSVLERLSLVIIALLSVNLLSNMKFLSSLSDGFDSFVLAREIVLLVLPLIVAYVVFLSGEAQLASSHPPMEGPPLSTPTSGSPKATNNPNASASSKGRSRRNETTSFEEADIARALVVMVAQNVTQIAFLNAKVHKSKRVLFTGNFLRHNKIALRALSSMMHNWSQGNIQALFMEHEGYFGAIGAFLHSCERGIDRKFIYEPSYSAGAEDYEKEDNDVQDNNGEELEETETIATTSVSGESSSSSDEERNVIEDLLYKGEFPRRKSRMVHPPSL